MAAIIADRWSLVASGSQTGQPILYTGDR